MVGRHPTLEEMWGYCDGSAGADAVKRIERHVSTCSECTQKAIATVRELERIVERRLEQAQAEQADARL